MNRELYTLEGKPSLRAALPYALQHILAMLVTNMVPISIIAAAASPALCTGIQPGRTGRRSVSRL